MRRLGFAIVLMVLAGCTGPRKTVHFSAISNIDSLNYYPSFRKYCEINPAENFESNAVVSSFFGDHRGAIDFATRKASGDQNTQTSLQVSEVEAAWLRQQVEGVLNNPESPPEARAQAQKMLAVLSLETDVTKVFQNKSPRNARDFILEKAKSYHFLLLNEAHYSSQNRAFTHSLLAPLWKQGYRYLALETLGYSDTSLTGRGYPLLNTGYYTQDPTFGNLVREALALGYKLVTYETTQKHDGTLRDYDQALHIYQQTWQRDTVGKVLVHAGYGHIAELKNPGYSPMGSQLKEMARQDLLTVDQEEMTEMMDEQEMHPYYRHVIKHFQPAEPVVFVDAKEQVLVDPVRSMLVDMQVHHPVTTYVKGRPDWLFIQGVAPVALPKAFASYRGYLLQATPRGELPNTVPVDQLVIGKGEALAVPPGTYELRLIDCNGTLRGKAELRVE